ncbi:acyltransferase [Winogradskyella undariae]|uniref:acyltransferase n=1 Tax=Winogradskyella undariae TaxID=1285465 RepID=UPI00156B180F|nr:acyltransferase [Winogradskyella undariae]NRR91473.1 acyltransferase [Winogradskyella undariae]
MINLGKLISKIKGDKNYSIQSEYSNVEVIKIIIIRAKQILRGGFSKVFFVKTSGFFFKGKHVQIKHSHLFRAGKNLILGDNVSINALSKKGITLGDNVTIERNGTIIGTGVIANKGEGVSIGNNTGININVFIGGQGGVSIGNNVIIGPSVQIYSENHIFAGKGLIKEQGEDRKGVKIEDDCWIGGGAIILDGVCLGNKTIVAAGSVVNKSFDGNCVIGGVPAKLIKNL